MAHVMRRLFAKLVQGLTTAAAAVGFGTLAISALWGELHWFGFEAAVRVGAPAFLIGALFFPVDVRSLKSRGGFAVRAFIAAASSCALHRALFWYARSETEWPVDPLALDPNMGLIFVATAGATALAWLAQPALLRLARKPAESCYLPRLDEPRAAEAAHVSAVRAHAHRD